MTLPPATAIAHTAPDEVRAEVPLDASYPGFLGHFPGRPVLPAMCQILIAVCVLREALGRPGLRLAEVRRARFTRSVRPGDVLRLELRLRAQDAPGSAIVVEGRHACGAEQVAELRLVVADASTPGA